MVDVTADAAAVLAQLREQLESVRSILIHQRMPDRTINVLWAGEAVEAIQRAIDTFALLRPFDGAPDPQEPKG